METVYIYVIGQECGPVKVGISRKPWDRVATIGVSSPFKVSLLYCRPMNDRAHARLHERWFHAAYAEDRIHGEWFSHDLITAIDGIQMTLSFEKDFLARTPKRNEIHEQGWTQ